MTNEEFKKKTFKITKKPETVHQIHNIVDNAESVKKEETLSPVHVVSENHKWTDETVNQIKEDHEKNGLGYRRLAKKYGIPKSTVWKIINGVEWKTSTRNELERLTKTMTN